MSTWMILRSSAPCSEFGSGNGQPPGLLRFYQEAAWRGDDTLGISLGRGTRSDEDAIKMLADGRRKAVDCGEVNGCGRLIAVIQQQKANGII